MACALLAGGTLGVVVKAESIGIAAGGPTTVVRSEDYVDVIFRAACAMTGSIQMAEELVDETFQRATEGLRVRRGERDLAHLLRTLRRLSSTRRAQALGAAHARSDEDTPPVYAAIRDLPPPLLDAIVAVDVVGLDYADAARTVRVRRAEFMKRLYQARDELARRLQEARR